MPRRETINLLGLIFLQKTERKIKNLELKKSGNLCFYLCEFLSSKFNLLCFIFVFEVNFGPGLSGLGMITSLLYLPFFKDDND